MNYSYEGRVTWHDLSRPIQELLKGYQDKINNVAKSVEDLKAYMEDKLNNEITKLKDDQSNLEGLLEQEKQERMTKDQELADLISQFASSNLGLEGAKGQVVRTNATGKPLYADDHFFILRATASDEGVETLINIQPITLKDVFDNWERNAYMADKGAGAGGANDSASAKNSWTYNDAVKGIRNNGNWNAVGSFGSVLKYDNFWIKMSMNSMTGNDDDVIGFYPAYMSAEDSPDGNIHNIAAIRIGNIANQWNYYPGNFVLVYDFGLSTEIVLAYVDRTIMPNTMWNSGYYTSLYVYRKGGTIKAWSNNPQQSRTQTYLEDPGEFIEWSLPKTNPGWSTASYDIMKQMLDGICKVGFMTCSNDCQFYLDDQKHLFEDPTIYDIGKGVIYEYDMENGVYKTAADMGEEEIPWRSLLYNPLTEELFWYKYPGDYTKVKIGGSSSGGGSGGLIIDYNNYIGYDWNDNFYDQTFTAPGNGIFKFVLITNYSAANAPVVHWYINGIQAGIRFEYGLMADIEEIYVNEGDKLTFDNTWICGNVENYGQNFMLEANNGNYYPMIFYYLSTSNNNAGNGGGGTGIVSIGTPDILFNSRDPYTDNDPKISWTKIQPLTHYAEASIEYTPNTDGILELEGISVHYGAYVVDRTEQRLVCSVKQADYETSTTSVPLLKGHTYTIYAAQISSVVFYPFL